MSKPLTYNPIPRQVSIKSVIETLHHEGKMSEWEYRRVEKMVDKGRVEIRDENQ